MSFSGNITKWRGTQPNVLISGRVDANAQVVGDKTGYSLTAGGYSIRASDSQRATASWNSSTTGSASISSVTTTRASAFHGGSVPDDAAAVGDLQQFAHSRITAATTVTFTRGDASGNGTIGAVEVAEHY